MFGGSQIIGYLCIVLKPIDVNASDRRMPGFPRLCHMFSLTLVGLSHFLEVINNVCSFEIEFAMNASFAQFFYLQVYF